MREINTINTKKHFVVQLEQIYFMTEFKIMSKTDLQVCEAISLLTMCVEFGLNEGKLLFCGCQECPDWIQNLGLK